ncbi:phospholipase A2 inhibitor and Ly6/PLAUR domain-containing protein-like [Aquarana catesbeiana]|uniref:phospholipase A2 inhibitor and Ly6/PLAUR domain-containing protein-like n=1 Tax=Aquarana catesbeiana TaxID=8400 RepID=UPI003CC95F3F
MKSAIFSTILLFLFVQLIVPAYNTMCYSCLAPNSKTCKHEQVECPNGTRCMTISEEMGYNGEVYYSINKRCAMNLLCDEPIYGYGDSVAFIKIYPKCCLGDLCNSGFYEMPINQTKERGILCPTCHNSTLDGCIATRSTVCWGEKDQCMKFKATIFAPDGVQVNVSAQGCSSANACKYDYSQSAATRLVNIVENVCYLPTDTLPQKKKPEH